MYNTVLTSRFRSIVVLVLLQVLLIVYFCDISRNTIQHVGEYKTTQLELRSDWEESIRVELDASEGVFNLTDTRVGVQDPLHVASYKKVFVNAVVGRNLPNDISFDWYDSDEDGNIRLLAPVKAGVEFHGFWSGENGRGQQFYDSDMKPVAPYKAGITKLYAYYRYTQFRIVFDKNGGNGGDDYTVGRFGEGLPTGVKKPTRLGYNFSGYSYVKDNEDYLLYDAAMLPVNPYMANSEGVLYAIWSPFSYQVWLNYNGGKSVQGEKKILLSNIAFDQDMPTLGLQVPLRDGYNFLGVFDTPQDTGGVQYYNYDMSSARAWDKGGSSVLYARWTVRPELNVKFYLNGVGSQLLGQITVFEGQPMINLGKKYIPTLHSNPQAIFIGFYQYPQDNPVASGIKYYDYLMQSQYIYDQQFDLDIYAHWVLEDTYTVKLNDNSGSTAVDINVAQCYPMPESTTIIPPVKDGYRFVGYFDTEIGGVMYYNHLMQGVHNWDKERGGVLYARWLNLQAKVKIDVNGGEFADKITSQYITMARDKLVPFVSTMYLKRDGYLFLGYWDSITLGRQYYSNTLVGLASWDKDEDAILYARWQPLQYTVYLDLNYDKSPITSSYWINYGEKLPRMILPNRDGYVFGGWFDEHGNQYMTGDLTSNKHYDTLGNITLYARWIANDSSWYDNIYTVIGIAIVVVSALCIFIFVCVCKVKKFTKN